MRMILAQRGEVLEPASEPVSDWPEVNALSEALHIGET